MANATDTPKKPMKISLDLDLLLFMKPIANTEGTNLRKSQHDNK